MKTIPMEPDWKEQFRAATLKLGFTLALTKPQLEMLCAVADDVVWDRSLFGTRGFQDSWGVSERALSKRGLIRRKPVTKRAAEAGEQSCCELTPAGELVVEMVKLSGMFVEADAAIAKKSRKRG